MNKKELTEQVATMAGISQTKAKLAIEAMTFSIGQAISKGDLVTLAGFGTFGLIKRPARQWRNPTTGETVSLKPCKVPRFRAARALKEVTNTP